MYFSLYGTRPQSLHSSEETTHLQVPAHRTWASGSHFQHTCIRRREAIPDHGQNAAPVRWLWRRHPLPLPFHKHPTHIREEHTSFVDDDWPSATGPIRSRAPLQILLGRTKFHHVHWPSTLGQVAPQTVWPLVHSAATPSILHQWTFNRHSSHSRETQHHSRLPVSFPNQWHMQPG